MVARWTHCTRVATGFEKDGEQVSLLAVLDAYPYPPDKILEFPTMQAILQGLMKDLGRDPGNGPLDAATVREFLQRDGDALSILEEDHIWAMYFVAKNNHLLASASVPGCFSGDLLLFRATADLPAKNPNLRHGIDTYVGKSKIHDIHCRHQLMTEPTSLAKIGYLLANELDQCFIKGVYDDKSILR